MPLRAGASTGSQYSSKVLSTCNFMSKVKYWVLYFSEVLSTEYWVLGTGIWVLSTEYWVLCHLKVHFNIHVFVIKKTPTICAICNIYLNHIYIVYNEHTCRWCMFHLITSIRSIMKCCYKNVHVGINSSFSGIIYIIILIYWAMFALHLINIRHSKVLSFSEHRFGVNTLPAILKSLSTGEDEQTVLSLIQPYYLGTKGPKEDPRL